MKLNHYGFTVVEFITVAAVFLISATIAMSGITEIGQRDRVKSEVRDLKNIFFRARMESIRRNRSITVAFNLNGYDYMAFVDNNVNCEYDSDDEIIHQQTLCSASFDQTKGGGDGLTFVANDNGHPALRWDPKGFPQKNGTGFGAGTAYLTGENMSYRVIVSKTGNIRISSD